jgi:serine/threonine protein kinase
VKSRNIVLIAIKFLRRRIFVIDKNPHLFTSENFLLLISSLFVTRLLSSFSSLLNSFDNCSYVAPEILRGDKYGTEVDIWSMGVICYVLLAGYPPFYDEDQKKLFRKIKEGKYHFHQDYWASTSPDAMDMIRKMLCVNQRERWSATQLLSHPWITAGDAELQAKDLTKSLEAMKKFKAKMRFKAVAKAIMATRRMQNAFKGRAKGPSTDGSSCILGSQSESEGEFKNNSSIPPSPSGDYVQTEFVTKLTPISTLLNGHGKVSALESPVSVSARSVPVSPRPPAPSSPSPFAHILELEIEESQVIMRPKNLQPESREDSVEDDSHLKACIDIDN